MIDLYRKAGRYGDAVPLLRKAISSNTATAWSALPGLFGAQSANLISREEGINDSLNVMQRAVRTSAGEAVNALGVRFAAGNDRLAQIVRRDQDLAAEYTDLDRIIFSVVAKDVPERDTTTEQQIRQHIEKIAEERHDLQARLAFEFPAYAALSNPQPLTVKEIQALQAGDEALVVVDLGAEQSYVWAITRDAADWRELPVTAAEVAKQVSILRDLLDVRSAKSFDPQASFELYREILAPVEDLLRGKPRWTLVLDGALASLPPQLLVTHDPTGKSHKNVDWLIRTHAITVLPSIGSLKVLHGKSTTAAAEKPLIGFANPIFGQVPQPGANARLSADLTATRGILSPVADVPELRKALPPLPETEMELKKVAASVRANPADLFLGADATETRVKQGRLDQYRIVYFATHSLVAGDVAKFAKMNPEPALVLSLPDHPTQFDDGVLTASEVAQLKLNADWVVLSACNTASAERPGAEAFSGLARAFFYAGARSLIVSNWAVESKSAVELMTGTFAAFAANPKLSHGEALRQSMLAVINNRQHPEWADPKYWAPFVVVGEPAKPEN